MKKKKELQNENYACGISNEDKVVRKLKRAGASKVTKSPGSRGAIDVFAEFPSGRKLGIQVKSTCSPNGKVKSLTNKAIEKLNTANKEKKATSAIAKVKGRKIEITYANVNRPVIL